VNQATWRSGTEADRHEAPAGIQRETASGRPSTRIRPRRTWAAGCRSTEGDDVASPERIAPPVPPNAAEGRRSARRSQDCGFAQASVSCLAVRTSTVRSYFPGRPSVVKRLNQPNMRGSHAMPRKDSAEPIIGGDQLCFEADGQRQIHRVIHRYACGDGHGVRVVQQAASRDRVHGDRRKIDSEPLAFVRCQLAPADLLIPVAPIRRAERRRGVATRPIGPNDFLMAERRRPPSLFESLLTPRRQEPSLDALYRILAPPKRKIFVSYHHDRRHRFRRKRKRFSCSRPTGKPARSIRPIRSTRGLTG